MLLSGIDMANLRVAITAQIREIKEIMATGYTSDFLERSLAEYEHLQKLFDGVKYARVGSWSEVHS